MLRSRGVLQGRAEAQGKASGQIQYRVGTMSAFFLVGTALCFDGAQAFINLVPVVGQIASTLIGFFAAVLFALWFFMLRINYLSGRKMGLKLAAAVGSFIGEVMPIIGAFPLLTAGVIGVIVASRLEDRERGPTAA